MFLSFCNLRRQPFQFFITLCNSRLGSFFVRRQSVLVLYYLRVLFVFTFELSLSFFQLVKGFWAVQPFFSSISFCFFFRKLCSKFIYFCLLFFLIFGCFFKVFISICSLAMSLFKLFSIIFNLSILPLFSRAEPSVSSSCCLLDSMRESLSIAFFIFLPPLFCLELPVQYFCILFATLQCLYTIFLFLHSLQPKDLQLLAQELFESICKRFKKPHEPSFLTIADSSPLGPLVTRLPSLSKEIGGIFALLNFGYFPEISFQAFFFIVGLSSLCMKSPSRGVST